MSTISEIEATAEQAKLDAIAEFDAFFENGTRTNGETFFDGAGWARDSYIHLNVQAALTYKYGSNVAAAAGWYYEMTALFGDDSEMDLYNNQIGRNLAAMVDEEDFGQAALNLIDNEVTAMSPRDPKLDGFLPAPPYFNKKRI